MPENPAIEVLKQILAEVRGIRAKLDHQAPAPAAAKPLPSGAPSPAVAPDTDLDGRYGDPVVNFVPRDWEGENYKGSKFSQCDPEFLDLLAKALDWFAEKAERENAMTQSGKPVARYKRADAARARGWAARIRASGVTRPSAPAKFAAGSDHDW